MHQLASTITTRGLDSHPSNIKCRIVRSNSKYGDVVVRLKGELFRSDRLLSRYCTVITVLNSTEGYHRCVVSTYIIHIYFSVLSVAAA